MHKTMMPLLRKGSETMSKVITADAAVELIKDHATVAFGDLAVGRSVLPEHWQGDFTTRDIR